jgi:hypothetical protein
MFSLVLLNLFASLFALHASAGGYVGWHMDKTYTLVNERIDPIVNPNAISQHQHKVIGSSRFGASYSYDDYNGASCTSVEVQADKSAYWMPSEYELEPLNNADLFRSLLGGERQIHPITLRYPILLLFDKEWSHRYHPPLPQRSSNAGR